MEDVAHATRTNLVEAGCRYAGWKIGRVPLLGGVEELLWIPPFFVKLGIFFLSTLFTSALLSVALIRFFGNGFTNTPLTKSDCLAHCSKNGVNKISTPSIKRRL